MQQKGERENMTNGECCRYIRPYSDLAAPHGRSEVAAHRCIPRRPSRKGDAAAWPGRPAPKDPDAICDKNSTYFGK